MTQCTSQSHEQALTSRAEVATSLMLRLWDHGSEDQDEAEVAHGRERAQWLRGMARAQMPCTMRGGMAKEAGMAAWSRLHSIFHVGACTRLV